MLESEYASLLNCEFCGIIFDKNKPMHCCDCEYHVTTYDEYHIVKIWHPPCLRNKMFVYLSTKTETVQLFKAGKDVFPVFEQSLSEFQSIHQFLKTVKSYVNFL